MNTKTPTSKRPARSARERQLIKAIESYITLRGDFLEMASTSAEMAGDAEFETALAACQASLEHAEAAIVPFLQGRLPVIYQNYCYSCDDQTIRTREVQIID